MVTVGAPAAAAVAVYVEAVYVEAAMKAVWKSLEVHLVGGKGGAPESHAVEGLVPRLLKC